MITQKRPLILASAWAASLAAAAPALASINAQTHSSVTNSTYVFTEDALLENGPADSQWTGQRLLFSAEYNFLNDPLVTLDPTHSSRVDTVIERINTLEVSAGIQPRQNLSFHLALPLNLMALPGSSDRFGLGDARFQGKWQLTGRDSLVAVSVIPEVMLPTGDRDLYLSNGSFGAGLKMAFERDFGPLRASANMGYRYSPNAILQNLDRSQMLPLGLGGYFDLGKGWGLNAEASGALTLPKDHYQNPGEAYLGTRYAYSREAALTAGVSVGSLNDYSSGNFRAVVGWKFTPLSKIQEPTPPVIIQPVARLPEQPKLPRVVFKPERIEIREEIKFMHNSDVLTGSAKDLLNEVAGVMKNNRKSFKRVRIEGHTNELGSVNHNLKLSRARALSVKEYLSTRGIESEALVAMGFGKSRLKSTSMPDLSRERRLEVDRRVEFNIER